MAMNTSDILIVGAGSAGCVLARRLSENPSLSVTLLEAGGSDRGFMVRMPAGAFALMGSDKADWRYAATPDPTIGGRAMEWPGGRMLGGSSSINGMVYVRGQRSDFDKWVAAGADGWSFDECEPFFRKAECFEGQGAPASLGTEGPMSVSRGRTQHPSTQLFLQACEQSGLALNEDYCDGRVDGAFPVLNTTRNGQRASTSAAYLRPVLSRPNLRVVTGCLVDRVIFEGQKAIGIRAIHKKQVVDFRANHGVVISAGAIASPSILLRSGIGPADELRSLGVDVIVDSPQVGKNLQEHSGISISKLVDFPTYNSPFGPISIARDTLRYTLFKDGPMTSAAVQAMAYAKSDPLLSDPDIAISYLPLAISFGEGKPRMHSAPGISIGGNVIQPRGRGEIRIRSTDPRDKPVIEYPLLQAPEDLDTLVAIAQLSVRLFDSPAIREHVVGENLPSPLPTTDQGWQDYIREYLAIGYHPSSTCRMGREGESVVDSQLKVWGAENLRVIDTSAFPNVTSGNTNGPTVMLAERGSEFIAHSLRH